MTDGEEGLVLDAPVIAALLAEAQDHVAPLRLAARPAAEGFVADLVSADGRVAVASYSSGPDELTAILAAEQRYLVEQVGSGSVRGETYVDKARERIRRGPAMQV